MDRTKGQTMVWKTLHRKLMTKQHELHNSEGKSSYSGRISSSCSTSDTNRFSRFCKPGDKS